AATLATAQSTADATIAAIVSNSPGAQIVLTNGTDIVSGETFTAPQVYTPGGNARINSLQDEDQLTGTGVTNVLTATLGNANDNGGTLITPKLTNIQTLNAAFTGSSSAGANLAVTGLDLQDATGLKTVNISRIA
ncbi:hypothetical protein ACO0LH_28550, partial [Undibacterium sp. TJN19]